MKSVVFKLYSCWIHVNIAHKTWVMEKDGIALINCFNDTFYIPQFSSEAYDFTLKIKSMWQIF